MTAAFTCASWAQTLPPSTGTQPAAQTGAPNTARSAAPAGHDMASMTREGSGTAWQPDESPLYMLHRQAGAWTLMAHENAFVQFLHDAGPRGAGQAGSINWVMGMAERTAGRGRLTLRGMLSAEPWTIRGCGYPDLLASGEQCAGEKIHDRQHPHDLAMELSAAYDAPLTGAIRWQLFGGPSAEPALGPVAYPHRVSAMSNPLAPIAHHWLDSTHVSFGVATGALYGPRWKTELSVFNGREPDEHRANVDFGAFDSVSARAWWLPTARLALQVSAGRLTDAEADDHGGPRIDVTKTTASLTYHRTDGARVWAATVAWGRNAEPEHATHALLSELAVTRDDRDSWFGRFEIVGKTAHDLGVVTPGEVLTVAKLQGGYTRYFAAERGFRPGIGVIVSEGFVPRDLSLVYGGRANAGVGVFLTLRPARLVPASSSGQTMVMVQTAFDPSKLACTPPIDPARAATTSYQGRTYYFCTAADRDEFLRDPAMSLSMMPPRQ